jgi:hypothetical protein
VKIVLLEVFLLVMVQLDADFVIGVHMPQEQQHVLHVM